MPFWLLITIVAHLANAVVFVVDKVLLNTARPRPLAYAFYTGVTGAAAFLLIPFFGFVWPTAMEAWLALVVGATFIGGLLAFFHALAEGEASRIVPVVGGFVPIFTLLFSESLGRNGLSVQELIAFGILVVGGILMTLRSAEEALMCQDCSRLRQGSLRVVRVFGIGGRVEHDHRHVGHHNEESPEVRRHFQRVTGGLSVHLLEMSALAGALFAASFVFTDLLFETAPFVAGFVWTKATALVVVGALLLVPSFRLAIRIAPQRARVSHATAFFLNRALAGAAFVGLNFAIAIGPVTLINAFQGVQYAFLFVLAVLLSWRFPQLLQEDQRGRVLAQKTIGIAVISAGLLLLSL